QRSGVVPPPGEDRPGEAGGQNAMHLLRHPDRHLDVRHGVKGPPARPDLRSDATRSRICDHADADRAAGGGLRWKGDVENEVLRVDGRYRLREREAVDAKQVRSLRAVGQDAAVAYGTAVLAHEDGGSRINLEAGFES